MRPYKPYRGSFAFTRELIKLPREIKIISIFIGIYVFGWAIASPFLPIYFLHVLGSYTAVGFVTTLLYIFSFFWVLPIGSLLDRVSKKRFLTLILILYLPLAPFLLALKTIAHFVLFRIYHSLIATSLWTSCFAFVREHSPRSKTAESFGLFDTAHGLALVIGPAIGGVLMLRYGFNTFLLISVFAALALIPLLLIRERQKMPILSVIRKLFKTNIFRQHLADLKKTRNLLHFAPLPFFIRFSSTFLHMLLPLFMLALGADFLQIGILVAVYHMPKISEAYFSALADHGSKKFMITVGLVFGALGFLLLWVSGTIGNTALIFITALFLATCLSAIIPAMQGRLTELMPGGKMGELSGDIRALEIAGSGLGPLVAGLIADSFGLRWVFLLGSAIFLALALFTSRLKF
jgi:MFS family permease